MNTADRIAEYIAEHEEQAVQLLQELVRAPSVPGQEGVAQLIVFRELHALGLDARYVPIETDAIEHLAGYADTRMDYAERPNVVATRRGKGGGRTLILSAHIDVVPVEQDSGWTRDPWGAEIEGRRLYGRGSNDDKVGIATIITVLRALNALNVQTRGDIEIQSVPDEEGGGNGTLALCAAGHRADGAIFVDSVRGAAVIATMGQVWFRITVFGQSAGAVSPERDGGVNPILLASKLIEALDGLKDSLNDEVTEPFGETRRPYRVNIGEIHSGVWANSVPARCVFKGQMNFLPGRNVAWAQEKIRRVIGEVSENDAWLREHPPLVEFIGPNAEAWDDTTNAELLNELGAAHQAVWHEPLRTRKILGYVDTRHYLTYGIPSLCYGARGGNAHGVDEYVELDTYIPVAQTLGRFVVEWCEI